MKNGDMRGGYWLTAAGGCLVGGGLAEGLVGLVLAGACVIVFAFLNLPAEPSP